MGPEWGQAYVLCFAKQSTKRKPDPGLDRPRTGPCFAKQSTKRKPDPGLDPGLTDSTPDSGLLDPGMRMRDEG